MKQSLWNNLSVSDILRGTFTNKRNKMQKFRLDDGALREFTNGICDALNIRDKDAVFENLKYSRVKDCGILSRIGVAVYNKKLHFSYTAGQEYNSETRLVRKLLRCK